MIKYSLFIIFCFSGFFLLAQKTEKKIEIKLDSFREQEKEAFIKNMYFDEKGNMIVHSFQYFRGEPKKGKPITFSEQKTVNKYDPLSDEKYNTYFTQVKTHVFDKELNILSENTKILCPGNGAKTADYIKIPKGKNYGYPEDLSIAESVGSFLKSNANFKRDRDEMVQLVSDTDGVLKLKNAQLLLKVSYDSLIQDEQGAIVYKRFSEIVKWKNEGASGFLIKELEPFKLSDGSFVQHVAKHDEENSSSFYKSNSFIHFTKDGKIIDVIEDNHDFVTKVGRRVPVISKDGKPKGVFYYATGNQMTAVKQYRNPKANEFYCYYFNEVGKLIFKTKFQHGQTETNDTGFKPIFVFNEGDNLLILNANNFGFSKKKGLYEKMKLDFDGKILGSETYEPIKYTEKFANRADFIDLNEIVFENGKIFNISKAISPAVGDNKPNSMGMSMAVLDTDLNFEFVGEVIEHSPNEQIPNLTRINTVNDHYFLYGNFSLGMYMWQSSNFSKYSYLSKDVKPCGLFNSGKNFIYDKDSQNLYFINYLTDQIVNIEKVKLN